MSWKVLAAFLVLALILGCLGQSQPAQTNVPGANLSIGQENVSVVKEKALTWLISDKQGHPLIDKQDLNSYDPISNSWTDCSDFECTLSINVTAHGAMAFKASDFQGEVIGNATIAETYFDDTRPVQATRQVYVPAPSICTNSTTGATFDCGYHTLTTENYLANESFHNTDLNFRLGAGESKIIHVRFVKQNMNDIADISIKVLGHSYADERATWQDTTCTTRYPVNFSSGVSNGTAVKNTTMIAIINSSGADFSNNCTNIIVTNSSDSGTLPYRIFQNGTQFCKNATNNLTLIVQEKEAFTNTAPQNGYIYTCAVTHADGQSNPYSNNVSGKVVYLLSDTSGVVWDEQGNYPLSTNATRGQRIAGFPYGYIENFTGLMRSNTTSKFGFPTDTFTIAATFRVNSVVVNNGWMITKQMISNNNDNLYISPGKVANQIVWDNNRGCVGEDTFSATIAANVTYRMVITYDGTTFVGYLNGARVNSTTSGVAGSCNGGDGFALGANAAALNNFYTGYVGYPIIENRVWNNTEVLADYNSSSAIGPQQGLPTINSLSVNPNPPTLASDLTCNGNVTSSTFATYNYTGNWSINGILNTSFSGTGIANNTNSTFDTKSHTLLSPFQNVSCTVQVTNGTAASAITMSANDTEPGPSSLTVIVRTAIVAWNGTIANYTFNISILNPSSTDTYTNARVNLTYTNGTALANVLFNLSAGPSFTYNVLNGTASLVRNATDNSLVVNATTSYLGSFNGNDSVQLLLPIDPVDAIILKGASNNISIAFLSANPAGINTINLLSGNDLNTTYNLTATPDAFLNLSTVKLYYKTNSSLGDCRIIINGSTNCPLSDNFSAVSYTSNSSSNFSTTLDHQQVYPGTFNLDPIATMSLTPASVTLANQNNIASIEILNITNTTQYNYLMAMVNGTGANNINYYYCNSTYAFNAQITTSPNCALIGQHPANQAFNETEAGFGYQVIPFAISNGQIGTVYVTPQSFFMMRGPAGASSGNVWNLANNTRPSASRTSTTTGSSWTPQTYTIIAHAHQFTNATSYWEKMCANATNGTFYCSGLRQDLLGQGGLPPQPPIVSVPTNTSYVNGSVNININYSAAISPNGYAIAIYNISLRNADDSFNKTIATNNYPALTYLWNTSGVFYGQYEVQVEACDVNNLCSQGHSDAFTILPQAPDISCTLQAGLNNVIFKPTLPLPCPSTANLVYPENQTNPAGTYVCTNNGTLSGILQVKVNQTPAGIVQVASADYFASSNVVATTSYQDLQALAIGASANISRYNNYSTCVIPLTNMTFHIRT